MWEWIHQNLNEIGVVFTVLAFVLSLIVLAMSAFRYVSVRRDELKNLRYVRYHTLLRNISTGADGVGLVKLISQRAFIYELRHFPEYGVLTKRLLDSLLAEWKEKPAISAILTFEIQDTISAIK